MLLNDLASLCGRRQEWVGLKSVLHGVREEVNANEKYVVPEVRTVSTSGPVTSSLLLITAPAAVGKSTAASFLSNSLRAPVLDLSNLQVGDATLEGSLSKAFGPAEFAKFYESLIGGQSALIIDALDEAEVRSGQANFQAFLRGLAETASEVSGRPSIVMLSRAESARALTELFSARGIQYSHYEILPFSREQAQGYLDERMYEIYSSLGKEATHRRHVVPYEKARDQLFLLLSSVLTDKEEGIWEIAAVRDFLGYAPVLDVAAEFLAVDNFANLYREFSSEKSDKGTAHWDLVAQVIDHLLVREQDKFVSQFIKTPEFAALNDDRLAPVIYTPEEQCARLLDHIEKMSIPLNLPAHLPEKIRDPYETAVSAQLANHPFLRGSDWFNVIFRDYVTARALTSVTTSDKANASIRNGLLSSAWKHSPMFGYFTHTLSQDPLRSIAMCHSEVIGALYESFKSMCDTGDMLHCTVGKNGKRLIASFGVVSRKDTDYSLTMGPLVFQTFEDTLSVTFPRELSFTEIYDVPEVMLGGDGRSFKFGPGVHISCGDLLVTAKDIQVFGSADGEERPTVLNVGNLVSDNVKIRVESAKLILISEDASYPWSQYQQKMDFDLMNFNVRESYALYLEMRRIVLRFKDAKKGEAALFQPFVDNLIIGENKRARTALEYLQSIGCVVLRNSMYLLDLGEFAKLGISRPQLRDLEVTDAAVHVATELMNFSVNDTDQ
ncbi:hypothetical protein [Streptomyces sp. NBC_01185]|uniref:hypothetical protein n=1 Tax=Streptomyces sp. NBC_01185 TaxID=2903764 RepID=UPI003862DE81|nr:hypothetical protein OG770_19610 [Streptomyces sp. NBC_01185]